MNDERRRKIEGIKSQLEAIRVSIEALAEEEQESFDNLPDSIQDGEKGNAMQEAISSLNAAFSCIEEAEENLDEAKI